MIFLVARNQSMGTAFGSDSRITAVTRAIQTIVEKNFPYAVNYAYAEYPSQSGCSAGANSCCVSSDYWLNIGKLNNRTDGLLSCDAGPPNSSCVAMTDGRPVAPTLLKIQQWLATSATNTRYAILLADGPPGCPGEGATDACNDAVTAITNLAQPPTRIDPVVVVALGEEASKSTCLRSMATAGGYFDTPTAAPAPVTVTDGKSLSPSLVQIVAKAALDYCTINLNNSADPSTVSIAAWGDSLAHDSSQKNGWEFWPSGQTRRIQVYGDACAKLQAAPRGEIQIYYTCPAQGSP